MVAYRFEDSRSGECVARHLDGYRGTPQVDGCAAYNRLGKASGANDAMTFARCWAHARRKFFDLLASDGAPFAGAVVRAMAPLWAIEDDNRGQDLDLRAAIRAEKSAPIVSKLLAMLDRELPASRGNRNWPRPCAIRSPGMLFSNASSSTVVSRSTPTSSSGPSDPRPAREKAVSLPAVTGAAVPGQPWPLCSKRQR